MDILEIKLICDTIIRAIIIIGITITVIKIINIVGRN